MIQNGVDECLEACDACVKKSRAEVVAEPLLPGKCKVDVRIQRSEFRVKSREVCEASQNQPKVVFLVILDSQLENGEARPFFHDFIADNRNLDKVLVCYDTERAALHDIRQWPSVW